MFKSTPKHKQGILAVLALLLVAVACDMDSHTALPPEAPQEQPPVAAKVVRFSPDVFYRNTDRPFHLLRFKSKRAFDRYNRTSTGRLEVAPERAVGLRLVVTLTPTNDLKRVLEPIESITVVCDPDNMCPVGRVKRR